MKPLKGTLKYTFATLALLAGATGANAEMRITIIMAGEAYDGFPAFEVSLDNKVVGHGKLSKAIDTVATGRLFQSPEPTSYLEHFQFVVPAELEQPNAQISVALINDKFTPEGHGHDRNLFVHSVEVNGTAIRAGQLRMMSGGKEQPTVYQAGLMPVYHQNDRAVAVPPEGGWPSSATARTSRLIAKPATGTGTGG